MSGPVGAWSAQRPVLTDLFPAAKTAPPLFWIGLFLAGRLIGMTAHSISRYPVPKLENLPEDIRAKMLEVQEKAGFIPNVFLTLAHRPDEFRAFFAYHDALMVRESGLTKAEKEMIVVATSGANDCLYCIVAHGAILRVYAKNALVADQVTVNYRKADISDRQKAMLKFALKVALQSVELGDGDFHELHAHGFSHEDIWDIGAITAFFALSNRMANLIAMRPNDEFYLLGRLPKADSAPTKK
jgi:uncharacterized peroxidase-related enzyme